MTTWLAVGDEAGNWDNLGTESPADHRPLAVALVAAPLDDWLALHRVELVDGATVAKRLGRPLPLPAACLEDEKPDAAHHVKPALGWLKDLNIGNSWSLDTPPATDELAAVQLWQHLRWLGRHRRFVTLGVAAPLAKLRSRYGSNDPAQALGALYGRLGAWLLPFLGADAELWLSPGPRSEPPDSLPIQRVRIGNGEGARVHGDHRGLVSRALDEGGPLLRRLGLDEHRLRAGTLGTLLKDRVKGRDMPNFGLLGAVADLGAALICTTQFPNYAIRLDPAALPAVHACAFDTLTEV